MSGVEIAGLPQWVWDLVMAIDRYEDEHPPLYRYDRYEGDTAMYEPVPCPEGEGVYKHIPREVHLQARVLAEYMRMAEKEGE